MPEFRVITGGYFNYLKTLIQRRKDKIKYYIDKIEAMKVEIARCEREISMLRHELAQDMAKLKAPSKDE